MGIGCCENRRNLAGGEKREKAHIRNPGSSGLEFLPLGPVADENQADAGIVQGASALEQGVPSAIETEVARVQQDKLERSSDGLNHRLIEFLRRVSGWGNLCAVAHNDHAVRTDA